MQASSTLLHNSTKPPLNQTFRTIQGERLHRVHNSTKNQMLFRPAGAVKKILPHPQYLIAFHIVNPLFMKLVVKKLCF